MSRSIQFVEYACSHSAPVRGSGGKSALICPACRAGYRKLTGALRPRELTVARMMGHTFSYDHIAYCEQCATCIP